jgi:hypothetical protein
VAGEAEGYLTRSQPRRSHLPPERFQFPRETKASRRDSSSCAHATSTQSLRYADRSDDTYSVTFGRLRACTWSVVETVDGVYVSELRETVERGTGLRLSL